MGLAVISRNNMKGNLISPGRTSEPSPSHIELNWSISEPADPSQNETHQNQIKQPRAS